MMLNIIMGINNYMELLGHFALHKNSLAISLELIPLLSIPLYPLLLLVLYGDFSLSLKHKRMFIQWKKIPLNMAK